MDRQAPVEPAVLPSETICQASLASRSSQGAANWLPALLLLVVAYGLLVAPVV